jgi:hypothetical protein
VSLAAVNNIRIVVEERTPGDCGRRLLLNCSLLAVSLWFYVTNVEDKAGVEGLRLHAASQRILQPSMQHWVCDYAVLQSLRSLDIQPLALVLAIGFLPLLDMTKRKQSRSITFLCILEDTRKPASIIPVFSGGAPTELKRLGFYDTTLLFFYLLLACSLRQQWPRIIELKGLRIPFYLRWY